MEVSGNRVIIRQRGGVARGRREVRREEGDRTEAGAMRRRQRG